MNWDDSSYPEGFSQQDIIFECPECSKSLGIDRKGAGLIIRCPDCGTRMRVPSPDWLAETGENAPDTDVFTGLNERVNPQWEEQVHRLEVNYEDMQRRKQHLEQLRVSTERHLERLREEMAVMQASLDRMVDVLQVLSPETLPEEQ